LVECLWSTIAALACLEDDIGCECAGCSYDEHDNEKSSVKDGVDHAIPFPSALCRRCWQDRIAGLNRR
jgi:hypothetical protein